MSQSSYVKSGFPQDVSAKKRRDLEYFPKIKELITGKGMENAGAGQGTKAR